MSVLTAAQLADVERTARTAYTSNVTGERASAEEELTVFSESADCIDACRDVLSNSSDPFAHMMAAQALFRLISNFWNAYGTEDKVGLRDFVLDLLAQKGPSMEEFVVTALAHLLSRLTKLAWFDSVEIKGYVPEVSKFLDHTFAHVVIGLRLFNSLLEELCTLVPGWTIVAHRKVAISFKESALYGVLEIALGLLTQLQGGKLEADDETLGDIAEQSVVLATRALSYDFVGSANDNASEEHSHVQIPATWRPLFEEHEVLKLFFDVYLHAGGRTQRLALQCLRQMTSVRRSLFSNEAARLAFLERLLSGMCAIMRDQVGLNDTENFHELCRLLSRVKSTFQLTEIVKTSCYDEWIELAATVAVACCENWRWNEHGVHYVLSLWSRLCAATAHVKATQPHHLSRYAQTVLQAYVGARLESVRHVLSDPGVDDPLLSIDTISEEVKAFPGIGRFMYGETAEFFFATLDPLVGDYEKMAQRLASLQAGDGDMEEFAVIEGQLSWLVYLIGGLVGGRVSSPKSEENDLIDGELAARIFNLMQMSDAIVESNGQQAGNERLELSYIAFFQKFRKAHIGDKALTQTRIVSYPVTPPEKKVASRRGGGGGWGRGTAASAPSSSSSSSMDTGATARTPPRTRMGLSSAPPTRSAPAPFGGGGSARASTPAAGVRLVRGNASASLTTTTSHGSGHFHTQAYARLQELMDLATPLEVLAVIISKIGSNLTWWTESEEIIFQTLDLFSELATATYSSARLLVKLEPIGLLLENHAESFRFLENPSNNHHRVTFYFILGCLVYMEDNLRGFSSFVAPIEQKFSELMSVNTPKDLRNDEAVSYLIGLFHDVHGLVKASNHRKSYNVFFEWFHGRYVDFVIEVAAEFFDVPAVTTPLLRFWEELVRNKCSRIKFDNSSPNGILLFKETAELICAYGQRLMAHPVPPGADIYDEHYQGVEICLSTFTNALSGGYCCFGVFALYNDDILVRVIDTVLNMSLSVPAEDLTGYPTLAKAFYALLETLFNNHTAMVVRLEVDVVAAMLAAIQQGLSSLNRNIFTQSCCAIDHLTGFHLRALKKDDRETIDAIGVHIGNNPEYFPQVMAALFSIYLFEDATTLPQWAVSRPILNLVLLYHDEFRALEEQIVSSQPVEHRARLVGCFETLMDGVKPEVTTKNRDKFTQNLSKFRHSVKQFIT